MREKDLNGKKLAKEIKNELKKNVERFVEKFNKTPRLAIVAVGHDLSAEAYIRSKQRTCKKVGIDNDLFELPRTASLKDLKETLNKLNRDESIHGIILEMPLPGHIPYGEAVSLIDPGKDVDGLHPANLGLLSLGKPVFVPNTPKAVMKILEENGVEIEGKQVTIVGRSLAVGKPLLALMLESNATPTVCHSRTVDLASHTRRADILVAAVGKAGFITADMIKEGAVVIDVGINVVDDGIVGDVAYEGVYDKASLITPVPGGVGPLTVAMILENTFRAAWLSLGRPELKHNLFKSPGINCNFIPSE
ncbi:MAG: bifunctional 5,10-methylenetetrahydrofolate dehydrogenase/5,10-methenyltetrahydrofolate cyclohydrolase [Vulcanimicrobiota bacterium]